MNGTLGTIGLVDADPEVRRSLHALLVAEGFEIRAFESAHAYLSHGIGVLLDCLVLDIDVLGASALELPACLQRSGARPPIVFLGRARDVRMCVRAMKAGAFDFLTKPLDEQETLQALRAAVAEAVRRRAEARALEDLRARLARLTPRELEVLRHVLAGKPNKQTAAELGTGEQTIKMHRMRISEKMGTPSVAELVRAAVRLQIEPAPV